MQLAPKEIEPAFPELLPETKTIHDPRQSLDKNHAFSNPRDNYCISFDEASIQPLQTSMTIIA